MEGAGWEEWRHGVTERRTDEETDRQTDRTTEKQTEERELYVKSDIHNSRKTNGNTTIR